MTLAGITGHRPVSSTPHPSGDFHRAKHYPHRDRSQALPSGGPIARPLVRARPERRYRCSARRSARTCAGRSRASAEREALVVRHQGYRATYDELWDQVDVAARALLAHGVGMGDRVGIWAPNRYEWVVTQFATARVGAILVTINPAYKSAELAYALQKAGVSVLVLARGFRKARLRGHARGRARQLPRPARGDRARGRLGGVPGRGRARRRRRARRARGAGCSSTTRSTSSTRRARRAPRRARRSRTTTSSTTRTSRRARSATASATASACPCRSTTASAWCSAPSPASTHGACIVVPGRGVRSAAPCSQTVEAERCTSLYGVPTMFIAELEHPDFERFDLSSLRTGMMGGAPCPVEVMKQVRTQMHMDEVTIICGMTETSPVSTQTALDDPLEKRVTTVGRVHPHVEVKIVDPETGAIVPRGTPGEQCTRGYSVMLGYWDDDRGHAARDRRRRLDAHRRPRGDGRRRLRQHRRPDQGHDHPRRREHLSARDRGVPLPACPRSATPR